MINKVDDILDYEVATSMALVPYCKTYISGQVLEAIESIQL